MQPVRNQSQYNPYSLPRISREVHTKTFESEDFPGQFLTLSLRKLNGPDNSRVAARWMEAHAMYVTGEHELCKVNVDEGKPGVPLEFPGLDGDEFADLQETELDNGGILQNAASLERMQVGESKHPLEFFVGICFRDCDMWNQINRFAVAVNTGKAPSPKETGEKPEDSIATASSSPESPAVESVIQS